MLANLYLNVCFTVMVWLKYKSLQKLVKMALLILKAWGERLLLYRKCIHYLSESHKQQPAAPLKRKMWILNKQNDLLLSGCSVETWAWSLTLFIHCREINGIVMWTNTSLFWVFFLWQLLITQKHRTMPVWPIYCTDATWAEKHPEYNSCHCESVMFEELMETDWVSV